MGDQVPVDGGSLVSWNTFLSRTSVSSLSCAVFSGKRQSSVHGLGDVIKAVRALNLRHYRYEDYSREGSLGEGETCYVERCVARDEETVFSVKHLKIWDESTADSSKTFQRRLRSVILELQIMRHAPLKAHPNIRSGLGYGWNTRGDAIMPFIVVECASLGTLREHIRAVHPPLSDVEILLVDVASGLAALHVCGIVHGDVKLDNVLVSPSLDRPAKAVAKLTDFGHAQTLNDASVDQEQGQSMYFCTVMYNAPEVHDQANFPIARDDLRNCDMWAFGLLIWEAAIGGDDYMTFLNRERLLPPYYDERGAYSISAGDLLGIAKRSIKGPHLEPAMFLRVSLHKTLQKDPVLRLADASGLPPYTGWNANNAAGLQAKLALHIESPSPTYEVFRLDRDRNVAWAYQRQIFQSLEQTHVDRWARDKSAVMWQLALCHHIGLGTPRDPSKALELARMATTEGHAAAEIFAYVLDDVAVNRTSKELRDGYAADVLSLLRSNPASTSGMSALVQAFFEGNVQLAKSLLRDGESLRSSAIDGCGPLHWFFTFQDSPALEELVDVLSALPKAHQLARLINMPFSSPRECHSQWPLQLLGTPLAVAFLSAPFPQLALCSSSGQMPFLQCTSRCSSGPRILVLNGQPFTWPSSISLQRHS